MPGFSSKEKEARVREFLTFARNLTIPEINKVVRQLDLVKDDINTIHKSNGDNIDETYG